MGEVLATWEVLAMWVVMNRVAFRDLGSPEINCIKNHWKEDLIRRNERMW